MHRRIRPLAGPIAALLVLWSAAACRPEPAGAQALSARVAAAPDGVVRFAYASREGVCGMGEGIGFRNPARPDGGLSFFGTWSGNRLAGSRETDCVPGPLRVELTLRAGRVTDVEARVGGSFGAAAGAVTELGEVGAEEAARYLLSVAETTADETALLAAVLAADVELSADLLRIARSRGPARGVRDDAVLWVALLGDRAAVRGLHAFAEDASVDEELRGHAIFAIGQTQHAEDSAFLRALYGRLQSEELKEKAIFSISQVRGEESARWLHQVAADRTESESLREKALFWLAEKQESLEALDRLYATLETRGLREQVIFAYSRRDQEGATERLLRIARSEADEDLRGKAIFWLGQKAGREITGELAVLAGASTQSRAVQEQAVFALSQRRGGDGVPALIELARSHRDPEIRRKALFWLGQSGDPRAVDLLEELLK